MMDYRILLGLNLYALEKEVDVFFEENKGEEWEFVGGIAFNDGLVYQAVAREQGAK